MEITKAIVQGRLLSDNDLDNARDIVLAALEDDDTSMCLQAVRLSVFLGKFDQAILPLAALLQSDFEEICIEACVALGSVTDRSGVHAIAAVVALLGFLRQSANDEHKIVALKSLSEIAFAGHQSTRSIMMQIIKGTSESAKVRAMAMQTLGCVCLQNDEEAVSLLATAVMKLTFETRDQILNEFLMLCLPL